jgi:hypothetical protein
LTATFSWFKEICLHGGNILYSFAFPNQAIFIGEQTKGLSVIFAAGRKYLTQRSNHSPEIAFRLGSYFANVLQQSRAIIALVQGHCPMHQVYQEIVGSVA